MHAQNAGFIGVIVFDNVTEGSLAFMESCKFAKDELAAAARLCFLVHHSHRGGFITHGRLTRMVPCLPTAGQIQIDIPSVFVSNGNGLMIADLVNRSASADPPEMVP